VRLQLASRNVAADQGPPPGGKPSNVEMLRGEEIPEILAKLPHAWRAPFITAVYCGLRRNEQLALRWSNVDLNAATMRIVEALEEAYGRVTTKMPKTKAGVRTISLPQIVVDTLREHRKEQLEERLMHGMGKMPDDALIFPTLDGNYQPPTSFSVRWRQVAKRLGIPHITWHSLRHSHASMLIGAGLPVTVVSARLGHANPAVTLAIYSRMFSKDDRAAAQAIDRALG
jgi:integrase